ncbi:alpha/beta hydrolase [Blastococcus sp. MG754426]|uniref:alpha/beta hydrolase fold domain-containing protein n=1 Tax=unclassified Blastococcus TaxID=2619396 RepID=UPI001EF040C3|nr:MULTISPECIES: alpha/beta hydrolase [unclassified Blastococcus]MCF6508283.1 alpha/beta hydrolase [Blastococcus sp. MG754426]MCF6512954.1 alpha/beta hydrolase [Blastococcus sp. MG754427]MCF6734294.1 alpha/beta hydrolase [Blastococcus sp. KM273129]
MPSAAARLLPPLMRLLRFRREFEHPERMLRGVEERLLRPVPYGPPRGLGPVEVEVDARHETGWPVYRVLPRDRTPERAAVYVHGGAWVNQIHPLHWRLVGRLAARSGTAITVPVYPLAPRGTAATVVPRVADLLAALADRYGAGRVTAMGDSAGGQIALSAALLLRDRGVPPLHRTVLVSPAVDLTLANPEIDLVEPRDPWLARPGTRAAIELWRGGLPLTDPLVSPLFGELAGLGPLTVFSGTRDITSPDTRLLVERARAAGVPVDHHEEEGLVHVHPLLPVPEGRRARRVVTAVLAG